jgi:hypothetical protein
MLKCQDCKNPINAQAKGWLCSACYGRARLEKLNVVTVKCCKMCRGVIRNRVDSLCSDCFGVCHYTFRALLKDAAEMPKEEYNELFRMYKNRLVRPCRFANHYDAHGKLVELKLVPTRDGKCSPHFAQLRCNHEPKCERCYAALEDKSYHRALLYEFSQCSKHASCLFDECKNLAFNSADTKQLCLVHLIFVTFVELSLTFLPTTTTTK